MRIGIDIRPLQAETRFRGIGKTLEFFLLSIPESTTDVFVLYADRESDIPEQAAKFPGVSLRYVPAFPFGRKRYLRSFLPSYRHPRPDPRDIDVFLQFDATLGIPTSVPTVTIFYDVIPLLFRDQERKATISLLRRPKDRLAGFLYWQKYLRVLRSYKKSTHIVSISQSSKDDLLSHVPGILPDQVSVVPLGVDVSFSKKVEKTSKRVQALTSQPYLLYVGGIDTRKNIVELLRTFYTLKPKFTDLRLVVVGKEFLLKDQLGDRGWYKFLRLNQTYARDVVVGGFVAHDELLYLYQHASCFVFPSLYEGFGLPILEAMSAGCPVVAYRTSSISEVAGNACTLVEPSDNLSDGVGNLLSNTRQQRASIKAGKAQAARFSWDRTVAGVLGVAHTYAKK
jgi:glycosyltransferase involved in cell wall biosynthesis